MARTSSRKKTPEPEPSRFGAALEALRTGGRVAGGLLVAALAVSWIAGFGPLRERVGEIRSEPIRVAFAWPGAGDEATWVPASVRDHLEQLAVAGLSMDPFDGASLARARDDLLASGWFREVHAVRRVAGGVVEIDAEFRTPAAVVRRSGREYLIGLDTAPMRLPAGTAAPERLYRILDPRAEPPQDPDDGSIAYGEPWHFDDVAQGVDLLERVTADLGARSDAIVAVDLAPLRTSGRLELVTNAGCRLVWGAPLDQPNAGEARVARKIEHLRHILDPARRLDRGRRSMDVFTEYVTVDNTAPRARPGAEPR